jgi:hypothetical protein
MRTTSRNAAGSAHSSVLLVWAKEKQLEHIRGSQQRGQLRPNPSEMNPVEQNQYVENFRNFFGEQMPIANILVEFEYFGEVSVRRLARPRKRHAHSMLIRPQVHRLTTEFASVVTVNHLRYSPG